jgi:hypothetical protein
MYYCGANAALPLYDITNAATFESVRGWSEGLFRSSYHTHPTAWFNRLPEC